MTDLTLLNLLINLKILQNKFTNAKNYNLDHKENGLPI